MKTEIELPFADGTYLFRLPIRRIVEIEAKAGPIDLVKHRLMHGGWGIHDVVETIRQALIGGAKGEVNGTPLEVSALRANSLIDNYVDGHALAEHHLTAKAVIAALYVGYAPAQEAKKKAPLKPRGQRKSTGASSSTTSEPLGSV